jgi:hypothetical protein
VGIGPRKSSNVCSLTAALVERKRAHGNKLKHKSIVVESSAYPWWASENPLEVFWGQLNEAVSIVPVEKFLEMAKQAMGRQVFKEEFSDRAALVDELLERTDEATLREVLAKIPRHKQEISNGERDAAN